MLTMPVGPRPVCPRTAPDLPHGRARPAAGLGLAAATCVLLVAVPRASAQLTPTPTGSAAVDDRNGNGLTISYSAAPNTPSKGKGLSIVGEKVFKPATESYKVGDTVVNGGPRNATKTEEPKLQALTPLEQKTLDTGKKMTPQEQEAALKVFQALAVQNTLPVNKDFPLVKKDGTKILTGTVSDSNKPGGNDKSEETASATAVQDATNPKKLSTVGTTASATAVAGKAIPNPMAAAFAVNLDPTSVTWQSSLAHTVTGK